MTKRSTVLSLLVLLASAASCSGSNTEDADAPSAAGTAPAASGGASQQDNSGGTRPHGTGGDSEQQGGAESAGSGAADSVGSGGASTGGVSVSAAGSGNSAGTSGSGGPAKGGASGSGNSAGEGGVSAAGGSRGIENMWGDVDDECVREYDLASYTGSVEGLCPAAEVNHCDCWDRGQIEFTVCAPDGSVCISQYETCEPNQTDCSWLRCHLPPTSQEEEFCSSIIDKVENPAPLWKCVRDADCQEPELCVLRVYNRMFCADPNAGSGGAGGKGASGAAGSAGAPGGAGGELAKAGAGGS